MNDDQSVVQFTDSVWVRLLFMCTMVMTNWVMLATLTSVVTENMASHAASVDEADARKERELSHKLTEQRLFALFREMDTDGDGEIDSDELQVALANKTFRSELEDATNLTTRDLVELFHYISYDHQGRRIFVYDDFLGKLKKESAPANERALFRMEELLRASEHRMCQRFENLMRFMQEPRQERNDLKPKLRVPPPAPKVPEWEMQARAFDEMDAEEVRLRERLLNGLLEQAEPAKPAEQAEQAVPISAEAATPRKMDTATPRKLDTASQSTRATPRTP